MAKSVHNDVLDAALNVLKTGCNKMTACEGQPLTYAEANTAKGSGGKSLSNVVMAGTDFAINDGDTSGRKVSVGQKTGVTVDQTGTADHVALLDTTGSRLLYVTTATSQVLTAANTMTFNTWDVEIADPS